MTAFYLSLYVVLIGMAIWSPKDRRLNGVLLFVISFVMSCPAWRTEGPDREIYLAGYDGTEEITERSFSMMREFALSHNMTEPAFFWIYAFIAIAVVLLAIYIFNRRIWWCVLVYFSYFYVLHPMIQIRASCSIAFFLLASALWNRWTSIPAFVGAFFWHSSAGIGIVGYVVSRIRISPKAIVALVVGSAIVYLKGWGIGDLISRIPISFVRAGFDKYNNIMDAGHYMEFHAFGLWKGFLLTILFLMLLKINRVAKYMGTPLFLNLWALGLCFSLISTDYPVLSNRGGDFLCSIEPLLLPSASFAFLRRLGVWPVIGYCLANTAVNVIRTNLLTSMIF